MDRSIFQKLLTNIELKEKVVLVTFIDDSESELINDKLLVNIQSKKVIEATNLSLAETEVEELLSYISVNKFHKQIGCHKLNLNSSERRIEFIIEPYHPQPRLIICGGGHIGQSLYNFGKELDFELVIVDDRSDFANYSLFPEIEKVICTEFEDLMKELEISSRDYVIIATRGHQHDYICLKKILSTPAKYIGMLGSQRKVTTVFDELEQAGYSKEKLDEVKAPIGLRIGSETPEEIAVSILAEIIEVRRETGCDNIMRKAIEFIADYDGGAELALTTVIETSGSTPRQAGAKMVVLSDGRTIGTIGGGGGEVRIEEQALNLINSDDNLAIHSLNLDNETVAKEGMICGGKMEVLIESFCCEA